jgi:glycosyltransferase involved in cell wall biosynthesis
MSNGYNVLSHNADNGGCGHYRMKFQNLAVQTLRKDIRVIESTKFIPAPQFYNDIRLVRIQRQVSNEQTGYILNFLKPLSQKVGFYLVYEIDDVIGMHDIPKYNTGWNAYQNLEFMENVRKILSVCDYITVTTKELGDYYVKKFGANKDNILVIPNYIPRWWMDGIYDLDKISRRFDTNANKRRICFASSTTHFDINNTNGGVDDFTHILPFIEKNVDNYKFVFIGGVPNQLMHLMKDNKVEYYRGFDILNYPKELNKLNIDLIIAPLQDNIFNRCKSQIKAVETFAMGIPCICQNLPLYKNVTDLLFDNSEDLGEKVEQFCNDKNLYMNFVQRGRNIVDNGDDFSPHGWW